MTKICISIIGTPTFHAVWIRIPDSSMEFSNSFRYDTFSSGFIIVPTDMEMVGSHGIRISTLFNLLISHSSVLTLPFHEAISRLKNLNRVEVLTGQQKFCMSVTLQLLSAT